MAQQSPAGARATSVKNGGTAKGSENADAQRRPARASNGSETAETQFLQAGLAAGPQAPAVEGATESPSEGSMDTIRVMLVDDHPLFRQGARCVLEQEGDCTVVGEASDAQLALELARAQNPDVVVMDALLAAGDPLELSRQLRHWLPRVSIIMLTAFEDEEQLFQSMKVGVAAYFLKDIKPEDLVSAVRQVYQGAYLINDNVLSRPMVASRVLRTFREMAIEEEAVETTLFSPLSSREVEILDYIARGNSNKEIAKSLKISDQTVKNHITSILKKLSVNDRTAAVVHALRHGWIKMSDM